MATNNSSSATSTNPTKSYTCNVTFCSKDPITWVCVEGKERAFRLHLPNRQTWDALTNDELRLVRRLTDDPSADSAMELTVPQMKLFADCCRRLNPINGYTKEGDRTVNPVQPTPQSAVSVAPANPTPIVQAPTQAPVTVPTVPSKPLAKAPETQGRLAEHSLNHVKACVEHHKSTQGSYACNDNERRVSQRQAVVNMLKGGLVHFQYDIPETVKAACPVPYSYLWTIGFRSTKSVWVMIKDRMSDERMQDLIAHWRSHGVRVRQHDFAEHEIATLRREAQEELEAEVTRAHTALITAIATADETLANGLKALETDNEGAENTYTNREKLNRQRFNTLRARFRTSAEELDYAIRCAENFDLTESVQSLLDGLRAAIQSQVSAFNAAARLEGYKTATVQV